MVTLITWYSSESTTDQNEMMTFHCYTETPQNAPSMIDIMNQVQTAREMDRVLRTVDHRYTNATYNRNGLWRRNEVITIAFKDGTDTQQADVKNIIMTTFQPLVDMKLDFINSPPANIVVSFKNNNGQPMGNAGFSRIGRRDPSNEASLHIGNTSKFLVQHEFLHHFNAHHEHSNPCAGKLNIDPSKQQKPDQFPKLNVNNIYCTEWDKDSVMNYPLKTDDGVVVRPGSSMSNLDQAFLQVLYKSGFVAPAGVSWTTPATQPPKSQ